MMHDNLIQRLYARTDSAGIADALCYEAARALNQGEMEMSDTPRTDAYYKQLDAWTKYAAKFSHLGSEVHEQCPVELTPEEFAQNFERELQASERRRKALENSFKIQTEVGASLIERVETDEAELEQYRNLRTDKTAVRVNLLRGLLARPDDLIFMHDSDGPYALLKAERDKLCEFVEWVKCAPVLSGICCCGDSMKGHPNPMDCGHSPVDMWDNALQNWIEELSKFNHS